MNNDVSTKIDTKGILFFPEKRVAEFKLFNDTFSEKIKVAKNVTKKFITGTNDVEIEENYITISYNEIVDFLIIEENDNGKVTEIKNIKGTLLTQKLDSFHIKKIVLKLITNKKFNNIFEIPFFKAQPKSLMIALPELTPLLLKEKSDYKKALQNFTAEIILSDILQENNINSFKPTTETSLLAWDETNEIIRILSMGPFTAAINLNDKGCLTSHDIIGYDIIENHTSYNSSSENSGINALDIASTALSIISPVGKIGKIAKLGVGLASKVYNNTDSNTSTQSNLSEYKILINIKNQTLPIVIDLLEIYGNLCQNSFEFPKIKSEVNQTAILLDKIVIRNKNKEALLAQSDIEKTSSTIADDKYNEIKKLKELLDLEIITPDEFMKKEQIY